jgi:diguanylate cyclase (GGDEF)-like protein
MKIEHRFKLAAASIFLVMTFVAAVLYRANLHSELTFEQLSVSISKEKKLESLLDLLRDAETGQRGFIITAKESFLAPYYAAIKEIPALHADLLHEYAASPDRLKALQEISRLVDLKLSELAETIDVRRTSGFNSVEPIVSSERGKQHMDALRDLIGNQVRIESERRTNLRSRLHVNADRTFYTANVATVANFLLLSGLMMFMFRLLSDRAAAAARLRDAADNLKSSGKKLEDRNQQMVLNAEMLQALGTVSTMAETSDIIAVYCTKILPGLSGTLYLYRNSRDLLEPQLSWGSVSDRTVPIEPNECWALRRGQPHRTTSHTDLCCPHYRAESLPKATRLCVPLVTQGEVIGLLYVEGLSDELAVLDVQHQEAIRLSEQIALALSNVKLRETLRRQSIVDALTGMYNRRYMDETLRRELLRAERKNGQLSIIMLDLDHFKRINDTYGHDAGDAVLKSVAQVINANIRASDLACRFGGEEMALILPECDMAPAIVRAEAIRHAIAALTLQHSGRMLGPITASFGIATFPQQTGGSAELIQAADKALYQAKNGGRNRVVPQAAESSLFVAEALD